MYKFKSNRGDVVVDTRKTTKKFRLLHWAKIIKEKNASSMSVKEYCESIGIHQNVFYYWQRKLREVACNEFLSTEQAQLPVSLPQGWAVCTSEQHKIDDVSSTINVEIGKFKIAVKCDDDMELFAKACQTLVSLC